MNLESSEKQGENKNNSGAVAAAMRVDYVAGSLDEADIAANPFEQFAAWFDEAMVCVPEPNAMILAVAGADGRPSARVMLLKGFSPEGFVFYTNYSSAKGGALSENPQAEILFFWQELQRQIRISGEVFRISAAESDEYFRSRPLGSRIGAVASPQSETIVSRNVLEERFGAVAAKYGDDVPRPDNWGGFRLIPDKIEFWQGRASRMHDRLRYRRENDTWIIERLAP
ncbi:pyridoxamine 5'-phosphate oxidase [Ignavibacteria bacterium]|nr:pyridoxamine 5'-phosphate oxidase [Bacteroidota bacterium]MCZ2132496.1 pyridoxamine 5'-phosphate oxidase [Bacteroidota bacterium]